MNKQYIKRLFIVFFLILFCFLLLVIRIILINRNDFFYVKANSQQFHNVNLIKRRANFLDSDFNKLTNEEKITKALIFPELSKLEDVKKLGCKISQEKLKKMFDLKKPFVVEVLNKDEKLRDIMFIEDKKRYINETLTPTHIIGYENNENEGISGLELHLNKFLKENGYSVDLNFPTNGQHKILNNNDYNLSSKGNPDDGIVLTIKKYLQFLLNRIGENSIEKGAGVILNSKTGEILAISSFPNFNPQNVQPYLKDEKKPLFNRAINNYCVGSIFKIVTAAAALNENINNKDISYNCTGCFKLKDLKFKCHNLKGHGTLNMEQAMKNSCNPYFINLGLKIKADSLLKTAHNFGFSRSIELCEEFGCNPSTLPDSAISQGELANFSFGQGKLKSSVLHIAQMLSVICNDGTGVVPQIIKGYVKNNKFSKTFKKIDFKCISKKQSDILKDMLKKTVIKTQAESSFIEAGGKSSTAQTGEFINEKEKLNTWFCSFAPASNPEIIIVLLKEDGKFGTQDLGPAINLINSYFNFC